MGRLSMDPETRRRFERICRQVSGRSGPGLSAEEIVDAGILAREESKEHPDPERLTLLRDRLGRQPPEQTSLELPEAA